MKINDDVVKVWSRILAAVPGSRLLLKYKNSFADTAVQGVFRDRFAGHGIPADRLAFLGGDLPREQQLAVLNAIDVALDPFPFNGSTTSFEALWMGVPLVTLAGDRFAARVGASLLTALGQTDWIAENEADYVRTAVGLAEAARASPAPRTLLRGRILASPLCDAPSYALSVEQAYRAMWREWCAGP